MERIRIECHDAVMLFHQSGVSFPRKQQYRRLRRAGAWGVGSVAALVLAALAVSLGALSIAVVLVCAAGFSGLYARHWLNLAGRAAVGARSETEVQRQLATLEAEGWRLRHSLLWGGQGDIDSVAIAPTGIAFAIETKTKTYTPAHLARVRGMAGWLFSRRRKWCRAGTVPVLCVVRGRHLERIEDEVLVVSLDRLLGALRSASGTVQQDGMPWRRAG